MRSALRYNAHGAIVYAAGALGVVYTPSEHAQQFHLGHTGDVSALCVSADGRFAASAERCGDSTRGRVHVWDALTGRNLSEARPSVPIPCTNALSNKHPVQ